MPLFFLRFRSNIGMESIPGSIRIMNRAEYIVGLPVAWAEQLRRGGVAAYSPSLLLFLLILHISKGNGSFVCTAMWFQQT
jgi:hypothetical protein